MKKLTIIPTKVLGRCIDDKSTKDLLVELYALVNYTRIIVNGVEILPGQLRTSLSELMQRTGLTKKMVRKRLDWLYAHQYIHKETNHHCLIITIVDYCRIHKSGHSQTPVNQMVALKLSTKRAQKATHKEPFLIII